MKTMPYKVQPSSLRCRRRESRYLSTIVITTATILFASINILITLPFASAINSQWVDGGDGIEYRVTPGGQNQCRYSEAMDSAIKAAAASQMASPIQSPKKSSESKFEQFLTPKIAPGQVDVIKWQNDGIEVDDYAIRVGVPPRLQNTLRTYAEGLGLYEIMTNMLYDDPLPVGGSSRFFSFSSPNHNRHKNFTWNVERPAKNWRSDMHWFNTADELAHEDSLRALAEGGFDEVLKGIGEHYGFEHLHVDSVGFVAVTNCDQGFIHTDFTEVEGKAFNFLFGIESPANAGPELIVATNDEEPERRGEIHYKSDYGIAVGDYTRHGTRECDHRAERGVRITCSIYLADLDETSLDVLSGDTTSFFPPTGDKDWIWAQRGRHWHRHDKTRSLVNDKGRRPMEVVDKMEGCENKVGKDKANCRDGTDERLYCWKTCEVFMTDEVYMPGTARREVIGY